MKISRCLTFIGSLILFSCHCSKNATSAAESVPSTDNINQVSRGAKAIVYKTNKDYSNLVPVTMNNEKTKIVSYPAPTDVFYKGKLAKPTPLKNGYLLDNRGINENTVFLNCTYEEYSRLTEAPSLQEMLLRVVEKNPMVEIIDCGLRYQYKDEVKELNTLIDANFSGCKKVIIKPHSIYLE
nr:hypothetical protein [uncultured Bacteroides sp.]